MTIRQWIESQGTPVTGGYSIGFTDQANDESFTLMIDQANYTIHIDTQSPIGTNHHTMKQGSCDLSFLQSHRMFKPAAIAYQAWINKEG